MVCYKLALWGKNIWNISPFLNLVKFYTINKFYEKRPIITYKKGTRNGHFWDTLKKHWHKQIINRKQIKRSRASINQGKRKKANKSIVQSSISSSKVFVWHHQSKITQKQISKFLCSCPSSLNAITFTNIKRFTSRVLILFLIVPSFPGFGYIWVCFRSDAVALQDSRESKGICIPHEHWNLFAANMLILCFQSIRMMNIYNES